MTDPLIPAATQASERYRHVEVQPPLVVVHPDPETLTSAIAARLVTRIIDLQSVDAPIHLVLTGGTVGIASLAEVATMAAANAIDWTGVHIWWGDERFLPAGDQDRNATQAREALLERLGELLPEKNIHEMPAKGGENGAATPEEAADLYAKELASFAPDGSLTPSFDILLLGMGPDGHIASLFPGHEALEVTGTSAVGVHGSPKPPPLRVSLTYSAINEAKEVWFLVAGSEKSEAVSKALGGAPKDEIPATGALGKKKTLWLVDLAATQGI